MPQTPRQLTYLGESLPIAAWAGRLGLSLSLIYTRLARGASDDEALRPAEHRETLNKIVNLDGVNAPLSVHAVRLGIPYRVITGRIRRGDTALRALRRSVRPYRRVITAWGRSQTVTEWAKELGVSRYSIYSRLRRGMSTEDALRGRQRQQHGQVEAREEVHPQDTEQQPAAGCHA